MGQISPPQVCLHLARDQDGGKANLYWREMTLSERIKSYRKREGITQRQLARRLGVTVKAISDWERGAVTNPRGLYAEALNSLIGTPKRDNFNDNAIFLNISLDFLVK